MSNRYYDPTSEPIPYPEEKMPEPIPDMKPAVADPSLAPGAGGWKPAPWVAPAVAVYCGIAGSVAPILLTLGLPGMIGAAILGGSAAGLGAYFGIRSAGPRKLE